MKAQVHPQYFEDAKVLCACGNTFITGSTAQAIHVELCAKCHPFYTGEQRFVDSASRIQKFKAKQEAARVHVTKKSKKEEKKDTTVKTLREMLLEVQ